MFNASNPPTRLRNQLVRFNQHGWITRIIKPYVLIAPPGHAAAEMLKRNSCSSLGCHGGLLGILWGVPPRTPFLGLPRCVSPLCCSGVGKGHPKCEASAPQSAQAGCGVHRSGRLGCSHWGLMVGSSCWGVQVGVPTLRCSFWGAHMGMLALGCSCCGVHVGVPILGFSQRGAHVGVLTLRCSCWGVHVGVSILGFSQWGAHVGVLTLG